MKQELYEILDERARLRVARFPLALGLSLGLHLAVIAIFLWGAGAGSPPPKGQPPNQEQPSAPSDADGKPSRKNYLNTLVLPRLLKGKGPRAL